MKSFKNYISWINKIEIWLSENERNKSWLARKCNVSPAAVKYWFDHKNKPARKHRIIINEIIGIKE
tara:strand:- start:13544 stop:13741 length:198 start_codon:yes stop_codon:yes gene_type:complete